MNNIELLRESNKYIDHTSIRQSLEERVESKRAQSGYTGVTRKRDKWSASITYKKKCYYLGCYSKLEDAVKARARAKQLVIEDAEKLLEVYDGIIRPSGAKPDKARTKKDASAPKEVGERKAE